MNFFGSNRNLNIRNCLGLDSIDRKYYAIAYDTSTKNLSSLNHTTHSWSHNCTGTNLVLCITVSVNVAVTVSSVTYNAVGATQAATNVNGNVRSEIWILVAPATGYHTVAVNFSGTTRRSYCGAVSLTGCNQTGQPEAFNSATGTDTTPTVSKATIADNSWMVDCASWASLNVGKTCTMVAHTNRTERQNAQSVSSTNGIALAISTTGPVTPAGTVVDDWTLNASLAWAITQVSIKPLSTGSFSPSISPSVSLSPSASPKIGRAHV